MRQSFLLRLQGASLMKVFNLKAEPDPQGGRIVLSWTNPDAQGLTMVKIFRRQMTYPVIPEDKDTSVVIYDNSSPHPGEQVEHVDKGLKGETTYYYAVVTYDNTSKPFPAFTSAMATTAYETAACLYKNLPGLYKNYDTVLPPDVPELDKADKKKGQLQRFIEMFGLQFDLLRSFASAMQNFSDINKVDAALLPLLAQWIGWQTNFTLSPAKQRNEITFAPHYYRTTGIAPNLYATVNRLTTWNTRIKEFVHNVFLSNNPEQLTIYEIERINNIWQHPSSLVSLDEAYEGRLSAIQLDDKRYCIFYHARVSQQNKPASDKWLLSYKINDTGRWLPARLLPLKGKFNKYPTVLQKNDKNVWLFWTEYNEIDGNVIPRIKLDILSFNPGDSSFTVVDESTSAPVLELALMQSVQPPVHEAQPAACEDSTGNVWLFWSSRRTGAWNIWYSRFNGTNWGNPKALTTGLSANREPVVLFDPDRQRIWVFWSRKKSNSLWNIFYRSTINLDFDVHTDASWTTEQELEPVPTEYDNAEPAAILNSSNNVELFYSSNQKDGWNIWSELITPSQQTPQQVTKGQFTQRACAVVNAGNQNVKLWFRSNETQVYISKLYPEAKTLDARYSGATSVDFRNLAKNSAKGLIKDIQCYTYDTGKNENDWYARDTVGIYLTPDTEDQTFIISNQNFIKNVLKQFLPAQVRAVFIIEPPVYKEQIYTYDFPEEKPQKVITEEFFDKLKSIASELYSGLNDNYQDTAVDWQWIRSWSQTFPEYRTVDFTTTPINTRFRTWHIGLKEGEN